MSFHFTHLPYNETNSFSHLVTDYLQQHELISPFYKYNTDKEGIKQALDDRKNYPVNRKALVKTLTQQYFHLGKHESVIKNLALLLEENTFTICTAHQPNLLTGYLYFIYKIIHAIKLAEDLKIQFPENNFIPVYYMGSEDNDLKELGTFIYNNKKFVWDANGQTGAVGRMNTESLKPLLDELYKQLGPPGIFCEELMSLLTNAYLKHKTITEATQYLVNELFGKYGLIVLDADDRAFKQQFVEVMKEDLLLQTPYKIVSKQIENLSAHYKVQAHPRPINLFYLKDNLRERIEKQEEKWVVLHTDISWTKTELINELEKFPERFSPNVILRGAFQETILPNIIFIGGGSELAYWLQLKTLFDHYHIFYPSLRLRQSVLWIPNKERKLREQLHFSIPEIFKSEAELTRQYLAKNSNDDFETGSEMQILEQVLLQLKQKAVLIDSTLGASAEAALEKIRHQVKVLEQKMLRAEKRKMQTQLLKITKLKSQLFPANHLQERVENFITHYLLYGDIYFDVLKENMQPLLHQFLVIEEET